MPLHPAFTFFWSNLSSTQEVEVLWKWLSDSEVTSENGFVSRIVGKSDSSVVQACRKIFAPHRVLEGILSLREQTLGICLLSRLWYFSNLGYSNCVNPR